ncbi:MAG: DUF488 domain-containing protein [Candidatus Baltobacteraceae bacterium]
MNIVRKRVYDLPSDDDGFRVLVDRVWPRGIKKVDARLDLWARELAPSTPLRQWFAHDPKKWASFTKRYEAELRSPAALAAMERLVDMAGKHRKLTLVYGAADTEHNQAVVLAAVLQRFVQRRKRA